MSNTPPAVTVTRKVKRIAPLQLGKMLAVLYGILGLLFLPVSLLMSTVASQLPSGQNAGVLAFGIGFGLFAPVFYAIMGFVFGFVGAFIYNLVAKWVGGIEVEVE